MKIMKDQNLETAIDPHSQLLQSCAPERRYYNRTLTDGLQEDCTNRIFQV